MCTRLCTPPSACAPLLWLTARNTRRKAGTGFCSAGLPSRPPPKHVPKSKASPSPDGAAERPRDLSPGRSGPGVAEKTTQAALGQAHPGPPNKSDPATGWGPIESLTVAALDFSQQPQRVPRDDAAFTDLAMWLANNATSSDAEAQGGTMSAEATGQDAPGSPAAQLSPEELLRFQKVAQRLLGLNRCALASLLQHPPQLDAAHHAAHTLWRSLPQAPSVPAVRSAVMNAGLRGRTLS